MERNAMLGISDEMIDQVIKELQETKPPASNGPDQMKTQKCSKTSADIRKLGNTLYYQDRHDVKLHMQALTCFSECIAYAPLNSEELAMGYNNRGMVLMHVRRFKKAVQDFDRAISITKSEHVLLELLVRKMQCIAVGKLHRINMEEIWERAKGVFQTLPPKNNEPKIDYLKMMEDIMVLYYSYKNQPDRYEVMTTPELRNKASFPNFSRNSEIPFASDSLALTYNEKFGRHFVATKRLKAGEILMVEDGFVYPNPMNLYITCSNCIEFVDNGIPCDFCVFTMYCSERCKKEAWEKYHDMECGTINYYGIVRPKACDNEYTFNEYMIAIMLLKRLIIFAVKEVKQKDPLRYMITQFKSLQGNSNENVDKRTKGFISNGRINGRTFGKWSSLPNYLPRNFSNRFFLTFVHLLNLEKILEIKEVDHKVATHLFTQLYSCITAKSLVVWNQEPWCFCRPDGTDNCHFGNCIAARGIILAPFCGLITHSCVANADCNIVNGKLVLYAQTPIREGEQIFINYGMSSLRDSKSVRAESLNGRCLLPCTCQACEENWPAFKMSGQEELAKFSKIYEKFDLKRELVKVGLDLKNAKRLQGDKFSIRGFPFDVGVEFVERNKLPVKRIRRPCEESGHRLKKHLYLEGVASCDCEGLLIINPGVYTMSRLIECLYGQNDFLNFNQKVNMLIPNQLRSAMAHEMLFYYAFDFREFDDCVKKRN